MITVPMTVSVSDVTIPMSAEQTNQAVDMALDARLSTKTIHLQSKSESYTPTESAQSDIVSPGDGYDGLSTVSISVGAIASDYVGSEILRKSSSDLTVSGATVTAPAGYYANSASKAVASGTAGTPTASKGTISNHSVAVTPSVTNTTGYISGGTKTGTAVTVSASELVSGTKSILANESGIDVTNYATVDVSVPAPTPNLQIKSKTYTPTTSQQTEAVTADSGYDGLEKVNVTVNAMPSGTAGTPTASKGTVSNHSVSVTPSVTNTTGYISGGTKNGTAITVSASELVSGSETKTENGTYDVTNLASLIVNVSGGGGSSYTKIGEATFTVNSTSTSATSAGTISTSPSAWTTDKIIYVRVRDTAGKRAGYFYGSDSFFLITNKANNSTSNQTTAARYIHRCSTSNQWDGYVGINATGYGVYGYSINTIGTVNVYRRYHSNYSLTINSTYKVEVYALDFPDGISPFDAEGV